MKYKNVKQFYMCLMIFKLVKIGCKVCLDMKKKDKLRITITPRKRERKWI